MDETHDPQQPDENGTPEQGRNESGRPESTPSPDAGRTDGPQQPGPGQPGPQQPAPGQPAPGAGPAAGGRQHWQFAPAGPPRQSGRFFLWLRSLGIRRGPQRWVGGVCSGLADKWGIDPVIVRGLAVILTLFFGIGLLAYGVAWALLPEPDGRIHVEEVGRGHWSAGMTGAAVVTLLGLAGPGQSVVWDRHGGWTVWPLFWTAAVVFAIVWFANRKKDRVQAPYGGGSYAPPAPYTAPPADFNAAPATSAMSGAQPPAGAPGTPGPGTPDGGTPGNETPGNGTPGYGTPAGTPPYGAQNYGTQNYGPAPYGTTPYNPAGPYFPANQYRPSGAVATARRIPRLGAPASLLVLGIAVVVGAAVLLLNASGVINLHGYEFSTAAAAAAITLGLGIIISGLRGRTAGGLGGFAILALVVAGLSGVVTPVGQWQAMSSQSWSPGTVGAAEDGYSLAFGNATIDLTKFDTGTPLAADVTVPIQFVGSKVTIKVPSDVPVIIKSDLTASSLSLPGQSDAGSGPVAQSTTAQLNSGAPGHALVIKLAGAGGSVTVTTVSGK